jgi:hypothetical protein
MTLGDLINGANRGFVSGTLGGPVDLANAAMGGIGGQQPVMGSQWIAAKLAAMGLLPQAGNPAAEAAGSMLSPSPLAKYAGLLALAKPVRAQEDAATLLANPTVQNLGVDAATSGQTLLSALETYLGRDGALKYLKSLGVQVPR